MTIKAAIQDWYERDGSFFDGVEILRRAGANTSAFGKAIMLREINEYWLGKLRDSLDELAIIHQNEDEDSPPEAVKWQKKTQSKTVSEPEMVLQLRENARMLHKRQSAAHAKMSIATTDEARFLLAAEIMEDIIPKLDSIYGDVRTWQKDGTIPPQPAQKTVIEETVAKMQRVSSLESRISRLKKLIPESKNDPRKCADYQKERLEKEAELLTLKNELGLCN